MPNNLFINGHISNKSFLALDSDILKKNEKALLLSHLDNCDECVEKYISIIESDMSEESFDQLQNRVISAVSVASENRKKRRNTFMLFQYCKLAVAVCLTLVMFYGGAQLFMRDNANSAAQTPDYIPMRSSISFTVPERRELKSPPKKEKRNRGDISNSLRDGFSKISDTFNGFISRGDK